MVTASVQHVSIQGKGLGKVQGVVWERFRCNTAMLGLVSALCAWHMCSALTSLCTPVRHLGPFLGQGTHLRTQRMAAC